MNTIIEITNDLYMASTYIQSNTKNNYISPSVLCLLQKR